MPLAQRVLGATAMEHVKTNISNYFFHPQISVISHMQEPHPKLTNIAPGREPLEITDTEFNTVMSKEVKGWEQISSRLWQSFNNNREKHWHSSLWRMMGSTPGGGSMQNPDMLSTVMAKVLGRDPAAENEQLTRGAEKETVSLNEIFVSLICCSRGTLGEKAGALFNIYSDRELDNVAPYHRTPVTKLARSITKTADSSALDKNVAPPYPDTEEARNNALRFTVRSNYPYKNTRLGDVYIATLGGFIGYAQHEAESQTFNIWGPPPAAHKEASKTGNLMTTTTSNTNYPLVCIGEIEMAVMWTPSGPSVLETGQLMIRIYGIKFFMSNVSDYYKMNPWVEVCTFRDGRESQVPRWDPRRFLATGQAKSKLTTHGAFGGHIHFDQTLRDGIFGKGETHYKWLRDSKDMGFVAATETWSWNEVWGKQLSTQDFQVEKKFVEMSARKNVMDILGVRNIVQTILLRNQLNLTNRQAILIADSIFNRAGAVPGILEAILVPSVDPEEFMGVPNLAEAATKKGVKFTVVTNEVALEHERQIALNGGFMNLFMNKLLEKGRISLPKHMNIQIPVLGLGGDKPSTMLWIRYVRGGDGQHCIHPVPVSGKGEVWPNVGAEVEMELLNTWPQTKVTKDEFVSCLLSNPILAESLRRMGSGAVEQRRKEPVALEVVIMDPHHEEADQSFHEQLNAQQSILLEIWDADVGNQDFLGEAWLPPLSTLGPRMKDFVLPLKAADMTPDAENGPSRESDNSKVLWMAGDATKITGEIYVSASWVYPAYTQKENEETVVSEGGETISDRAMVQEKLHTGKLTLKIHKCKGLRRADAKKGRDCDPQVSVWIRNDVAQRWRRKPLCRTKVVPNNRSPTFNFAPDTFDIVNGSYESRFPPMAEGWFAEVKQLFELPSARRRRQENLENLAVRTFGSAGLKICFKGEEDEQPGPGKNHKVQVFLGDSIREFKNKLTLACEKEAAYWKNQAGPDAANEAAKYSDVKIGFKHLAMVFVSSSKLQKLIAQNLTKGEEYRLAYHQALNDPSSWEPLDPARSFAQYPQFRFNMKYAQQMRVVEATEAYKSQNLRYKAYAKSMNRVSWKDTNTPDSCFGWAKYEHKEKNGNVLLEEWRPALVGKGDPTSYKVDWLYRPAGSEPRTSLKKDQVLLAPRLPLFDDSIDPRHQEFLEQASTLRSSGKSDWDIEQILNQLQDEKFEEQRKAGTLEQDGEEEITKPPRITVDHIRAFLSRSELEAAKALNEEVNKREDVHKGRQTLLGHDSYH